MTFAATAAIACAGYYASSRIGLQLRIGDATTSVLWPPNAFLTSILLLTPPRRWAPLLLCVLPVHVWMQLPTGWPLPLILILYLTNCSEALLAAGGIVLLSDAPTRFDTIRRLSVFLAVAVIAAPIVSSFADAGAVTWFRGEPYWQVWERRTLGNILAELTVVPGCVGAVALALGAWRSRATPRVVEAATLAATVVLTGWLHVSGWLREPSLSAVTSRTPLAMQLPLLLWAAVRFGPTGTGLALLATSLFTTWGVVHGFGPFAAIAASTTVTALTVSLIIVASTLLCLATLMEERRQTQQALRTSEALQTAILLSLPAGIAVLDRHGCLVQSNDVWQRSVRGFAWMDVPMGASLVKACRPAARADRHSAVELEAALSSVLEGAAIDGVIEQRSDGGPEAECWSTTVAPLNRPEGGAVLIRTDLTGLRRAEMDAQRSHQALAHVGRVSTVGELTASLAHQLSQPLTAILANAQAARRIMEAPAPDYLTVKAILADIVADDRRATDVIQHLRDFLRKGGTRAIRVSLPEIIVDVVRLLGSEAIIRNVSVQVQTGPGSHFVRGDRIQLQQVVLNLLHNAMDALGSGDRPRRITIECGTGDRGEVVLKVCDTGVGIEPGAEELVFDPFYTTKREGMGMGLSIVRSIVIAHGGAIRVTRSSDYSTIFEVTLPADRPVAEPRLAMRA